MLTVPPSVRIYLAAGATDLRRSIDGLSMLVGERLGLVTRAGEAFEALAPADALARLDGAWDDIFQFSARR